MGNAEWGMWNDEVNESNDGPSSNVCILNIPHSPFHTPHFSRHLAGFSGAAFSGAVVFSGAALGSLPAGTCIGWRVASTVMFG